MGPKRLWLPRVLALALLCAAGIAVLRFDPTVGHPPRRSAPQQTGPHIVANYGNLSLSFEANQGQADPQVIFLSRGQGYNLFLTPTEAVLQLRIPAPPGQAADFGLRNANRPAFETGVRNPKSEIRNPKLARPVTLRMRLVGANPNAEARGVEELPGKSNYFIGNDPSRWRTNVPTYRKVEYRDVYPGVNLVHYGNQRQLEYDFVVEPGADPRAIKFEVEGAGRIEIDSAGDLVLHVGGGEVRQHKPIVYQQIADHRRDIPGRFVLCDSAFRDLSRRSRDPHSHRVGFEIGSYDSSRPLVVDPVLVYSTYLGGSSNDQGNAIAVDSAGNAYVTGTTYSTNFPTASPLQATPGGGGYGDAFVAKLSATGSALVYSTYLGGFANDMGRAIAVDSSGNAYVTGSTTSPDFPTASPLQPTLGSSTKAFVLKLNATGSALFYSTYLGGDKDYASGLGIAVDSLGNAYVTGHTYSANFPLANPIQATLKGDTDAFVAKLNAMGSALVYSTYLGSAGYTHSEGAAIALDSSGNAYVTGSTDWTGFPMVSPLQPQHGGGYHDAFVAKLNATGSALLYSTYLGGSKDDVGTGIAVDSSGNAYVTGRTQSADFPTASPLQAAYGGGISAVYGQAGDAFVAKLNAAGSKLVYSTYLGGSGDDAGNGIAVDSSGNAHVTGYTSSADFPTASPFQAVYGGGVDWQSRPYNDVFVSKLNDTGSALVYSTYLGRSDEDSGSAVALDFSGNAYVAGSTASVNFPTVSPFQRQKSGYSTTTAFITKIAPAGIACTYSISPTSQLVLAKSGAGSVALTTPSSCVWTVTSDTPWLSITSITSITSGSSGVGSATVGYSVSGNLGMASRTGTLTIAGQTFLVTQAAATCAYAVTPTSQSFPGSGGNGSVGVAAASGCGWPAASNASWITITSGSSGSGDGTVNYSVATNTSTSSRSGTLTIAGQTVTVFQAAAAPSCSYSISPTSQSLPDSGGSGSVTVTAPAGCSWTAASNASWLTVTSGSTGTGNGTVSYSAAANASGASRGGALTVAGQTFAVTQASASSLSVSPGSVAFSVLRGAASPPAQTVRLAAPGGSAIAWTATASTAAGGTWLSVSPASGTTPANISVSVNTAGLTTGSYTGEVSITSQGSAPATISVSLNVNAAGGDPVIGLSPASLEFTTSVGTNPPPRNVAVSNLGGGTLTWLGTVSYTTGSGWLFVSPPGGNAPTTASVLVDAITPGLPGGTYRGQVVISALSGATNSPQTLPVTLTVVSPAQLAVSPQFLSFQAPQGSGATVSQAISITNAGSGALSWTASPTTSNGGDWLKLSAAQGSAPANVTVSANPAGLASGVYLGSIQVTDTAAGGKQSVFVALTVNPPATIILLSQSDFVFTTVESSPSSLKQTLRILNLGQGTLAWKLLATIPSGGNWLAVDQSSGSTTTDPATAAPIGVLVNPAGLSAGNYYGLLIASSAGATNSPQLASVHLRVLASTSAPTPSVLPSGFIFATAEGGAAPAAQAFSVQNLGGGSLPFKVSVSTADGAPWLSASPVQATAAAAAPATVAVQASAGNLRAGVYRGSISLDFGAGLTQDLSVILLITPASVSPQAALERPEAGCAATELQAVSTLLPNNFVSLVGWPVPIMVRVVDNCNNAVTSATVVATFAGAGYAPLLLKSLRDGLYSGTWVPLSNSRVRVTIKVLSPPLKEATVELLSQPADFTANLPLINPEGVVNGASFAARTPVAPGSIVSLFGRNLVSQATGVAGFPLPTNLGGLAMKIGDQDAPLFYANNGQVNAQVPVELVSNTAASVVLTMNGKVSPPEPLLLAPVQPGIFTYDDGGVPHAAALDEKNALVGKANPAVRGTIIQVYATGLGPTDPVVKTGEPGPSNPAAVLVAGTQLTATIGGVPAEIQFKGLAPGYVGLYQVNLRVPSGLSSGDVPLVLTANGLPSKEVMLPVK